MAGINLNYKGGPLRISLRYIAALLLPWLASAAGQYFQIRIVDSTTGRGVPMVALSTVNRIVCFTDSNGIVAWNEPGLMDRDVYFRIESPGYQFPGGGRTLRPTHGGSVELKIRRVSIAERMYRITGQGIYRDSVLTGFPAPIREPVLNAQVLGQDTVRGVLYRGKLFWVWGDTDRVSGPLGNFNTTGGTSELPGRGGLDPSVGIDITYFTGPDGFVKQMCPWPIKGPIWLDALMTVRDENGAERLVARYNAVDQNMKAHESGMAVFNDDRQVFERIVTFPHPDPEVGPLGVPPVRVRSGGAEYFYFCNLRTAPVIRVRADWKSVTDLAAYEVFDGGWKHSTTLPPKSGTWIDMETGAAIAGDANVQWNEYRKRWIGIVQKNPGEVWYAESDTPTGPWVYTTRVASNGNYFFYWPVGQPHFDQNGGRTIYFEGTYTDSFSGNPVITPRYNYNQLMYRLSLDDARLFLPAPVYRLRNGRYAMRETVDAEHAWAQVEEIAFFALPRDRRREGTIDVGGLFYAMPADKAAPAGSVVGSWMCDGEPIEITRHGERAGFSGFGIAGEGELRGGTAHFTLRDKDGQYDVTASPNGEKLALSWKGSDSGNAACDRDSSASRWKDSGALVPLYSYDGRYSTEARPGARPITRVWRNPVSVRVLDRDAAPVR